MVARARRAYIAPGRGGHTYSPQTPCCRSTNRHQLEFRYWDVESHCQQLKATHCTNEPPERRAAFAGSEEKERQKVKKSNAGYNSYRTRDISYQEAASGPKSVWQFASFPSDRSHVQDCDPCKEETAQCWSAVDCATCSEGCKEASEATVRRTVGLP
jgi:hypothetical protein